jgi:hypothetical protein
MGMESYKTEFNPDKELSEIRKGTKDEQRANLEEYKKNLIKQKLDLMRIKESLQESIEANPKVTKEMLIEIISPLEDSAGLTEGQKKSIETGLDIYFRKKKRIGELLELSKDEKTGDVDNMKIFKHLFDFVPSGDVRISIADVFVYIKDSSLEDYATINSNAFMNQRRANDKDIETAKGSGAVKLGRVKFPGLENSVIVERTDLINNKERMDQILRHEKNHVYNSIIINSFGPEESEFEKKEKSGLYDQENLTRQNINLFAEQRIKDEISSYFIDGTPVGEIRGIILNNDTIYDYGFSHKGREEKDEKEFSKQYVKFVEDGISAFKYLTDSGFSTKEANALLFNEPLRYWPRVVERITGRNKKQFEADYEKNISRASNLFELSQAIHKIPFINNSYPGSDLIYSPRELIDLINEFINQKHTDREGVINRIKEDTFMPFISTYGIHKKLIELLQKEIEMFRF